MPLPSPRHQPFQLFSCLDCCDSFPNRRASSAPVLTKPALHWFKEHTLTLVNQTSGNHISFLEMTHCFLILFRIKSWRPESGMLLLFWESSFRYFPPMTLKILGIGTTKLAQTNKTKNRERHVKLSPYSHQKSLKYHQILVTSGISWLRETSVGQTGWKWLQTLELRVEEELHCVGFAGEITKQEIGFELCGGVHTSWWTERMFWSCQLVKLNWPLLTIFSSFFNIAEVIPSDFQSRHSDCKGHWTRVRLKL